MGRKAKKKYRKWHLEDMVEVKKLRESGVKWIDIAKQFGTSTKNISKLYEYYQPQLDDSRDRLDKAVQVVSNDLEFGAMGIGEDKIRRMITKAIRCYER